MAWPMPEVRHFLACQRFAADVGVRTFSLLNVLYEVSVPGPGPDGVFGVLVEEVHVVAQLTNAEGQFGLTVDLVRLDDEAVVERADETVLTLRDKLAVYNFHRVMRNVPLGRPGMYEFRLYARHLRWPSGVPVPKPAPTLLASEPLRIEVR